MYTLILNKVLQYKLVINSFTKTASLTFRTNDPISIFVSQITARLSMQVLINIPNRIRFTSAKLRTKLSVAIRINRPKIFATIKTREKLSVIISNILRLSAIAKMRLRGNSIINIYNKLTFSPLLGIFYPLSDYDPQTLSTLDNLTLADMDFELI